MSGIGPPRAAQTGRAAEARSIAQGLSTAGGAAGVRSGLQALGFRLWALGSRRPSSSVWHQATHYPLPTAPKVNMPARIDFNCDMGESFGAYRLGLDEEIIKQITSANIACGFHAGDPARMRRTVRLAEEHGVGIGAHPGFPDLAGFGRRTLGA